METLPTCSAVERRPTTGRDARRHCDHTVQFYETDAYLVDALATFVKAGLHGGDQVIVIATEGHRRELKAKLRTGNGSAPALLQSDRRYLELDAEETLAKFMVDGLPHPGRFHQIVGGLFAWAAGRRPAIRAFGEMVALLWTQGNAAAALRLEEMWNELQRTYSFSLLCAYRLPDFHGVAHHQDFLHICRQHSRVLPAESFPPEGRLTGDEQHAAIAALQQKAVSLENELAERKRLEAELRRSKEQLAAFVETADLPMHWVGGDGRVVWANAAELKLLGYSREEFVGRPISDFHMDRDRAEQLLARLFRGEKVQGFEARLRRKDGAVRTVVISSGALFEDGRFVHSHCFTRDVTEHRRHEEASRHLAAIVESSDDAIVGKDLDGVIRSWNAGAERIFGYAPEEAIGRSIGLLIPPDRRGEEREILARIRAGRKIDPFETVRRTKQGLLIDVSLTISPIRNREGRIVGISEIARDITTRKRIGRELEQARDQALAASRAKDDFLAALSHELRTPLNPVLLIATEAAEDPGLLPEIRDDFKLIAKNVQLEARLIDDLLDLTRISRGKLAVDRRRCDLRDILRDAVAVMQDDLSQKRIAFSAGIGGPPCTILADRVRLLQVFWNLLKNAVKFTAEGGSVRLELRDAGDETVEVTLVDTGIGLTPGELKKLFTPFSQGEHAVPCGSNRFGGLGLGLAISRTLVELHDGSIRASSPGRDRGATFTVELPLAPAGGAPDEAPRIERIERTAAAEARVKGETRRHRILLVEDHASTRAALGHLLRRRGYDVIAAGGVTEAQALVASRPVDLVISDIGLPDGSGCQFMAELRDGHGIPGIALSGYGTEEEIARSRAAGFAVHLTKPVEARQLDDALEKVTALLKYRVASSG